MQNRFVFSFVYCLVTLATCSTSFSQIGGGGADPIAMFATNNNGFVQTGLNGPDNLILFDMPVEPPKDPAALPLLMFTVVGNLESDLDEDGDGALDSIGSFSGLEWSTGEAGVGTLIGCVLNEGNGAGEFYQIDPITADTLLIGQSPMVDGEQRDFSDLAFNPVDGLMYGVMNDIIDNGGNLDFGPNTLWVDTDGDLVPDTIQSDPVVPFRTDPFCILTLATFIGGMTFDAAGNLFVYDIMDDLILAGGVDSSTQESSPCALAFLDTDLETTELTQGNALWMDGPLLLISTDIPIFGIRNTIVSFVNITDKEIVNIPSGIFGTEFFQTGFIAQAAIGDMVGAMADLSNLPPTFPDALIVNHGTPAKDAVLEGVVLSDDFRYCLTADTPVFNEGPVDITVVFTVPDAANVTMLGVEVESNTNTENIANRFSVLNVNTNLFEEITTEAISRDDDETVTVDLSLGMADYLNPQTSQLIVRISSEQTGPALMFPWQVKYDNIIALSN